MTGAMNLLLLLSALLSALTGVGASQRATPAPAVAEQTVRVAAVAVSTARVIARPVAALPDSRVVAAIAPARAVDVVADAPIWMTRRRE